MHHICVHTHTPRPRPCPRTFSYVTNSSKAAYTLTSFKEGHNQDTQPCKDALAHPTLQRHYMHKHRIEYMSAIRPDAQTMNQTLRM